MKKLLPLSILMLSSGVAAAQHGLGTNNVHPSALYELSSNNKGLLIPRMSYQDRITIPKPALGLMVYQTDEVTINGVTYTPGVYTFNPSSASTSGGWSKTGSGTQDITGGSINGTPIGQTTAAAGKFTNLEATGTTTLGSLTGTGDRLVTANATGVLGTAPIPTPLSAGNGISISSNTVSVKGTDALTFSNAAITGGSIKGVPVGGSAAGEASTGHFTSLEAGNTTLTGKDINLTGALSGTGTDLVTIESDGTLGRTTAANNATALAGNGLTANAGKIDLGGTLTSSATINTGANNLTLNRSAGGQIRISGLTGTADARILTQEVSGANAGQLHYTDLNSTLTNAAGGTLGINLGNANTYTAAQTFNGGAVLPTTGATGQAQGLNLINAVNANTNTNAVISDAQVANNLTVNGGNIDATPIGSTTQSTGSFTKLNANLDVSFSNAFVQMSNLDNTGYNATMQLVGTRNAGGNPGVLTEYSANDVISYVNSGSGTVNAARVGTGLTDAQVADNLTIASDKAGSFNTTSGNSLAVTSTSTTATDAALTATAAGGAMALSTNGPIKVTALGTGTADELIGRVSSTGALVTTPIPTFTDATTASNGLTESGNDIQVNPATIVGAINSATTGTLSDAVVANDLTINGGSIKGTPIGGSGSGEASTGTFTGITVTGGGTLGGNFVYSGNNFQFTNIGAGNAGDFRVMALNTSTEPGRVGIATANNLITGINSATAGEFDDARVTNDLTITSTKSGSFVPATGVAGAAPTGSGAQALNVNATTAASGVSSNGIVSQIIQNSGSSNAELRAFNGFAVAKGSIATSGAYWGNVSGGVFSSRLEGGTLSSTGVASTVSGVVADAHYVSGTTSAANTFVGARFGSSATGTMQALSIGVLSTANGSANANIGVLSAANDGATLAGSGAQLQTATTDLAGGGTAILAVNPTASIANGKQQRAIYASGGVQLRNLGSTTATNLVGIDANGNLSTTAATDAIVGDDLTIASTKAGSFAVNTPSTAALTLSNAGGGQGLVVSNGATINNGLTVGSLTGNGFRMVQANAAGTLSQGPEIFTGSAAANFGTVSSGFNTMTLTVTGAQVDDVVLLSVPSGAQSAGMYSAYVSANNQVTIKLYTPAGVTPTGTFKVLVMHY